jgi:hypothetical protein
MEDYEPGVLIIDNNGRGLRIAFKNVSIAE